MTQSKTLCLTAGLMTDRSPLLVFDAKAMGLSHVGGVVAQECWYGPNDQYAFMDVATSDSIDHDPAPIVEAAYLQLFAKAKAQGFAHALRLWQFIPAINRGEGDQERYRRFCVGRAKALDALGLADDQMCAATAIGCQDETFRLIGLFGHQPGKPIENPRQISAWQYPREYGPVSPAFARATLISLNGQDTTQGSGLMVSGTAAVVGHASTYPNDVLAQTEEAMVNVETVLAEAKALLNTRDARIDEHSYVRAYVRHQRDIGQVVDVLNERWSDANTMVLLGDICRSELLVEIEAWHRFLPATEST